MEEIVNWVLEGYRCQKFWLCMSSQLTSRNLLIRDYSDKGEQGCFIAADAV